MAEKQGGAEEDGVGVGTGFTGSGWLGRKARAGGAGWATDGGAVSTRSHSSCRRSGSERENRTRCQKQLLSWLSANIRLVSERQLRRCGMPHASERTPSRRGATCESPASEHYEFSLVALGRRADEPSAC